MLDFRCILLTTALAASACSSAQDPSAEIDASGGSTVDQAGARSDLSSVEADLSGGTPDLSTDHADLLTANPDQSPGHAPYLVIENVSSGNGQISNSAMEALTHSSAGGALITIPWAGIDPSCSAPDYSVPFAQLASTLRADQVVGLGLAGGGNSPTCPGVSTVTVEQKYPDQSCKARTLPVMTSQAYATAFVGAAKALLAQAATTQVASGGTIADHMKWYIADFYSSDDAELLIEARGCGDQTKAQAVALWTAAGYTPQLAISTYTSIIDQLRTAGAPAFLQNTEGSDAWTFPQIEGAPDVLTTILTTEYGLYGSSYLGSWNQVQAVPPIPPLVESMSAAGMPWMLQFNATAVNSTTSCNGLVNGVEDNVTANPTCFAAMQATAANLVPPTAWAVEANDWVIADLLP